MRMCQSHWDTLRDEIHTQGMGDMISANGEVATMRMTAELQFDEEERKDDFDPLLRCWFMIMSRTLELVGLVAMTEDFGCPICTMNGMRTEDGACPCTDPQCGAKEPGSIPDFETWIAGDASCVASVKEMVVERGWL